MQTIVGYSHDEWNLDDFLHFSMQSKTLIDLSRGAGSRLREIFAKITRREQLSLTFRPQSRIGRSLRFSEKVSIITSCHFYRD